MPEPAKQDPTEPTAAQLKALRTALAKARPALTALRALEDADTKLKTFEGPRVGPDHVAAAEALRLAYVDAIRAAARLTPEVENADA